MSTSKETENSGDDQPSYERPPSIIRDRSEPSDKGNTKKLQSDSARQRSPLLKGFKEWGKEHVTPMNILTLVIAVAAWAQFHATSGQLETMNRQLDERRNSGKDTSNQATWIINNMNWLAREMHHSVEQGQASIQSARKESERTLDANIRAMQIDQRAWVGVTDAIPPDLSTPSSNLSFTVYFTNSGRTPALKVMERAKWHLARNDITPDPERELPLGSFTDVGVIQPGANTVVPTTPEIQPFTQEQARALILTQAYRLYIFGEIRYRDVFQLQHWTKYCLVLGPMPSKGFAFCSFYNDAN